MTASAYSVLSDRLVISAVVLYAAAMIGFAVEAATWARRPATGDGARRLVPAGAVSRGAERDPGSSLVLARGSVPDGPSEDGSPELGPSRTARGAGRAAMFLTGAGALVHAGSVAARGLAAGRVPWGNMYEFSSAICLSAVTVFLVVQWRRPSRRLGLFVLFAVLAGLGLATTVLYTPAGPLVPALHSYWITIHVTAAIIASGLFTVGSVLAVLYLLVTAGSVRVAAATRRLRAVLPAAQDLDDLCFRLLATAFPIWTFAVVAGAIWAESAWGRYWGWDPKETWAFITWVIYAAYLHARVTAGWRGRRAAVLALVGGAAFTFNYFGVNLWIVGLHSYAGTR